MGTLFPRVTFLREARPLPVARLSRGPQRQEPALRRPQ